jgi:hypothetical protein
MEDVEMIFETDRIGIDVIGIVDDGDDPAPFFFGGEPLYHDVPLVRQQQLLGVRARDQRLRLPDGQGPANPAVSQVAWIDERDRAGGGFAEKVLASAEIDHPPGRYLDA